MANSAEKNFDRALLDIVGRRVASALEDDRSDEAFVEFEYMYRIAKRGTGLSLPRQLCTDLSLALSEGDPRRGFVERAAQECAASAQPANPGARVRSETVEINVEERGRVAREVEVIADWPIEPLYTADWEGLDGDAAAELLREMPAGNGLLALVDAVKQGFRAVRVNHPSFYNDAVIVEALLQPPKGKSSRRVRTFAFAKGPDFFHHIQGTSPWIHETNARSGIVLDTEARRHDYLRFFCGCVHGEEGPFSIVESREHLASRLIDYTDEEVAAFWELCQPLANRPPDDAQGNSDEDDGPVKQALQGTVQYSNALFNADFEIDTKTGMIEMLDDTPLVADLRTVISRFDSKGVRYRYADASEAGSGEDTA